MPRVRVSIPDPLLQEVATKAQELGKPIDELYSEAVARYVELNATASPGSLRSRTGMPRNAAKLTVEIPEELFQRADKLAKRLGKTRDTLYSEALAKYGVKQTSPAQSALDQGHDLPSGAWRAKKPDAAG